MGSGYIGTKIETLLRFTGNIKFSVMYLGQKLRQKVETYRKEYAQTILGQKLRQS